MLRRSNSTVGGYWEEKWSRSKKNHSFTRSKAKWNTPGNVLITHAFTDYVGYKQKQIAALYANISVKIYM